MYYVDWLERPKQSANHLYRVHQVCGVRTEVQLYNVKRIFGDIQSAVYWKPGRIRSLF